MSYRLRITVQNPSATARKVVIYGGTVFEVEDPLSGRQNLVTVSQTTASIPPG